jgi:hypothetical protein
VGLNVALPLDQGPGEWERKRARDRNGERDGDGNEGGGPGEGVVGGPPRVDWSRLLDETDDLLVWEYAEARGWVSVVPQDVHVADQTAEPVSVAKQKQQAGRMIWSRLDTVSGGLAVVSMVGFVFGSMGKMRS